MKIVLTKGDLSTSTNTLIEMIKSALNLNKETPLDFETQGTRVTIKIKKLTKKDKYNLESIRAALIEKNVNYTLDN